jgi:hypothetical protein
MRVNKMEMIEIGHCIKVSTVNDVGYVKFDITPLCNNINRINAIKLINHLEKEFEIPARTENYSNEKVMARKLTYPPGKTPAQLRSDAFQTDLKKGDLGYIDDYVQADNSPYAVFVRESDGLIDIVPIFEVIALFDSDRVSNKEKEFVL